MERKGVRGLDHLLVNVRVRKAACGAHKEIKSEALTPQESGTIAAETDAFKSHLGDINHHCQFTGHSITVHYLSEEWLSTLTNQTKDKIYLETAEKERNILSKMCCVCEPMFVVLRKDTTVEPWVSAASSQRGLADAGLEGTEPTIILIQALYAHSLTTNNLNKPSYSNTAYMFEREAASPKAADLRRCSTCRLDFSITANPVMITCPSHSSQSTEKEQYLTKDSIPNAARGRSLSLTLIMTGLKMKVVVSAGSETQKPL
ncbi:hypothetical protein NQZ68_003866 [Dissostichus eleginoides]|nr:hypothetical protein NQZ68_003866 [Dissostichus eleginoides]